MVEISSSGSGEGPGRLTAGPTLQKNRKPGPADRVRGALFLTLVPLIRFCLVRGARGSVPNTT